MEKELVSIIIPTYNRAYLIGETIASIQKQTYMYWECLIIDDDSTDNTEEVVKAYSQKDTRITYYKKPKHLPKGPSAARNYGFIKSRGEYVNWFDSDDLMHPEKLETDLKYLNSGNFDFTISQSAFIKENGEPKKKYWNKNLWSEDPINDFIVRKIGWGVNTPLWKKKSLKTFALEFNEELITADDYLYHIQALEFGLKPCVLNQVLVLQREHPTRLNELKLKSHFKLKVNYYLMLHKDELNLKLTTIQFLKKQFHNQLLNLLKKKEIKLYLIYLRQMHLYPFKWHEKNNMYKNLIIGFLYKYFNYGYNYLNENKLLKKGSKKKIFCISMQLTNEAPIGPFFKDLNYNVANYNTSKNNDWPLQWSVGDYEAIFNSKYFKQNQVFEDDPWWFTDFYKVLYHRFPKAKFVLFIRDSNAWFDSMCSHSNGKTLGNTRLHSKLYRREADFYSQYDNFDKIDYNDKVIDNLLSLEDKREHYISIYELRNKEIIDFFSKNAPDRLFVSEVEDKTKWVKLGIFLKI